MITFNNDLSVNASCVIINGEECFSARDLATQLEMYDSNEQREILDHLGNLALTSDAPDFIVDQIFNEK